MSSRESSVEAGPSTRLLDTPHDDTPSSGMVYQPPPRTMSGAEQKPTLDRSDGKFATNPIVVLSRVPVICMSFASIIIQFTGHPRAPAHTGLIVLTWITFAYSIWALIHHRFLTKSRWFEQTWAKMPEVSCIVGGWKFLICGCRATMEGHEEEMHAGEPRKYHTISLFSCVDVVLAFLLLLFGILARTTPEWWRNRDYNMAWHPAFTLTCVIAGFLLGSAALRQFRVSVTVGSWMDGEDQARSRIRLL